MATGYVLAQFANSAIATSGDNTIFTVPAGHIYIIKQFSLYVTPSASSEIRTVKNNTRIIAKAGSTGSAVEAYNFANPSNNNVTGNAVTGTAYNSIFVAGDVLKINIPNTNSCDLNISGIDYTI